MPIPDFTEFGLLPEGIHDCTFDEAIRFLCTNPRRTQIGQGLQEFLVAIADLPEPDAVLVDGSFVTDKPLPSDVDVIIDLSNCDQDDYYLWVDYWSQNHNQAKVEFGVDFYPIVAGQGHDFCAFFQYVRIDEALQRGVPPTTRKGILKVQQ